jgi:dolichol-phosphate mannosyltransferase
MSPTAWLVMPTFNEAENIEAVVSAALAELEVCAPGGHRVLVVDDSSPDGTGELADGLAARNPAVEVLHRTRREGLGPAYLAGFHRALDGGASHVFQMDADFSHDPADLGRLLGAVADGADLALGSRYVPGGGVADWGVLRQIVSRAGCMYARGVLGLGVHDLTGGFKCFRREVLEAIELETVRSHGYCFQIEMTQRALRRGFSVREVPIVFRERRRGHSKMSPWIAAEAFVVLPQLRWRRDFR